MKQEEAVILNSRDIYNKVAHILDQCLGVEEDDIKPSSKIMADLGAESIDFLDITFRIEREFGIKIPQGELFPDGVFDGDNECTKDGKITSHGIDRLQAAAPHVTLRDEDGNLTFDGTIPGVQDVFTVGSLVKYIDTKIKAQQ